MVNRFQPQGNLQSFNDTDVIRFIINTQGFWNPYSAYLNIEVDFSDADPETVFQLDGSAHSLIRSLVIRTRSQEIERIEEYDTITNLIYDMNMSVEERKSNMNEGVGYSNDHVQATECTTGVPRW